MKLFSNGVSLSIALVLTACSEAKKSEYQTSRSDCNIEYAIAIPGVNCEVPDLVLSPLNVPETNIKGFAYENWIEDKAIANFGDVSEKIVRCVDNRFHICVSKPIPLILPRKLFRKIDFEVDGSLYSFETDESLDAKSVCDLRSLQFKITNEEHHTYVFSISKREGLLHYSVQSPEKLYNKEVYRIHGKMFSYGEYCDN